MNPRRLAAGFTLVEIMIVVVIIGLLAAIGLPAVARLRISVLEKTLLNDARQVSAAVQQVCSENSTSQCTGSQIAKFLNGGELSKGVTFGDSSTPAANQSVVSGGVISIDSIPYFFLGHPGYRKEVSGNNHVIAAGPATAGTIIRFSSITGQPE